MSTDWNNAFGGGGSKEVPALRPEAPSPSQSREEVGLLSEEAAAELKAKATEAGKRLAEGLGKGAARTADVAGRLGGQGAQHARSIMARLRQEHVGHNARVLCGAIIGLAVFIVGGIEWHAHRSIPAPQLTEAPAPAKPATVAIVRPVPTVAPPQVAASVPAPTPTPAAVTPTPPLPAQPEPAKQPVAQTAPQPQVKPARVVSQTSPVRSPSSAEINQKWAADANAKMDAWFKARQQPQQGGN